MGKLFNVKIKLNQYLVLSFFIPVIIVLVALAQFGMWPFGKSSISMVDMKGQYLDYYAAFRDVFYNKGSLFYSWYKSMGGNFFGLFANYLSSPFSLIVLLFPRKYIMEAIMVMYVIKIGCAGLSFSLFIKHKFQREDLMSIVFSAFYGLMSYPVMYMMNIMWMDGLIWLPIIILGVEKLILKKQSMLFVISLAVMIISNYYIGYMICLFAGLYFIYKIFELEHFSNIKDRAKVFCQFLLSALVASGLSAWLLVPTYYALLQGKGTKGFKLPSLEWNMNLYTFLSKLFMGVYDSITNIGAINIYCGVLMLILLLGYYFDNKQGIKEKVLSCIFLLILILSAFISVTDIGWHMFQMPTWFPYRYSFIIPFFMLTIAYKGWLNIKSLDIKSAGILLFIILFGLYSRRLPYFSTHDIYLNATVVSIYLVILFLYKYKESMAKGLSILLVFIVIGEIYVNTSAIINGLNQEFGFQEKKIYSEFIDVNQSIINNLNQLDDSIYRVEKTYERSKNDPMTLGYMGIAHYSSLYNQNLNHTLRNLGYAQNHIWTINNGATLLTDSLFGVKYLLTKDRNNPYEEVTFDQNNSEVNASEMKYVFNNPYVLGLGYKVDDRILDVELEELNPIHNQNHILQAMVDSKADYFITIDDVSIQMENVQRIKEANIYRYTKKNNSFDGYTTYSMTLPTEAPLYAVFPTHYNDRCTYFINNEKKGEVFGSETNANLFIGQFIKGQKVEFKLKLEKDNLTYYDHQFYYLDMDQFKQAIKVLREEPFIIEEFANTHLSGYIDVKEEGLLFTSIPYEEGWHIRCDGKPIKPVKILDTFIGIKVDKGNHHIEMNFMPKGLLTGTIISVMTLMMVGIHYYIDKKKILNPVVINSDTTDDINT